MRIALTYRDDKSYKFWTVDYSGSDLCVHYGKMNAVGKYEIKEFDTEEMCVKEAKRMAASKKKKGYQIDEAFDFNKCIYIDSEEYGLHRKTSHPHFSGFFTKDFYYDCTDEESPFGSDEGADTLQIIGEKLRKNHKLDFSAIPEYIVEREWGMTYVPTEIPDKDIIKNIGEKPEPDIWQSDLVTCAAAFAQIKTTGFLHAGLQKRALAALKRHAAMYSNGQFTLKQRQMYEDLAGFGNLQQL